MVFQKKAFRYCYWLIIEFVKKHLKLILLSFLLTFIFAITFVSLSPYIETVLLTKTETIGIVGRYDLNSVPEEISTKISNGLIYINEKGEMIPALATSWEIINGGKEYRFHLRDNLIWNDGKKFSAADIRYQFKDIVVKVMDDKTIYFFLEKPLPIFPTYLRQPIIKYPLVGVGNLYETENLRIKYGYIEEVTLSPNKKDLPVIKYKFYDNETQLINAYKRGDITQMTTTKKTIADVFSQWKNSKVTKNVDYTRLLTFFFDMNNPFLKEKEIRQAIESSIDRSIFNDFGEQSVGPVPPISWAYNVNLKNSLYQPDTAEKIIRKSTDASNSAKLKFTTYYDYLDVADQIVEQLRKVGLNVDLNIISYDKPDNFDMLLAFWKVPHDPDQYYFWHSTQLQGNIGSYKNVKIDKLLEDGRGQVSLDDRKKIYHEFQKVMLDDPPAVFLYYPYAYTIQRN